MVNFNLTLRRGEVLGLLGPNGAGKTTTLQVLSGNLAPSSGRVLICDADLIDQPLRAKRHIGYLPEHPPLYRDLTVDEFLRLCARLRRLRGTRAGAAIESAKARCGLEQSGRKLLGTLSKGYQQRVGIAQAIVHDPAVIILDEPTVGLDPNQIREIRALIRQLREGRSVILSTHILPEVETTCDRVEILHHGRIVFSDAIAGLERHGRGMSLRVGLRRPPPIEALRALPGVTAVERAGDLTFRLMRDAHVDPTDALVAAAVREDWGLFELSAGHSRLEEVFVQITRDEPQA